MEERLMSERQGVAVVTGGGSGIGRAICLNLAELGLHVAAIDLSVGGVQDTADRIREGGGSATPFVASVADAERLQSIASTIEHDAGPVEAVVCCAGIIGVSPAAAMTQKNWQDVMSTNLTGTFFTCQAFAARMLERRRGAIVTISSITGLGGQPGRSAYAASKWGVIGLTKSLALEWGHLGIRVNSVAPNLVAREGAARLNSGFVDEVVLDRTPLGRLVTAGEVAEAVSFLLSEKASFINGTVLPVDGGLTSGFFTHGGGADLAMHRK
jgi:3-oxoacyl-[acyl-carrier protein] reductase